MLEHTYVAEAGSHGVLDMQLVIPAWVIVVFSFFAGFLSFLGFLVIFGSVLVDCGQKKSGYHDASVHSAVIWMDMNVRQDDVVLGILI